MEIKIHTKGEIEIAEVLSEGLVISNAEEGLDLMCNLYFQGFDRVIVHAENIVPEFFDLKTGMAGEVLQKFSTYRCRLVLVGDFSKFPGKSLKDFIYESNQGRQVNFTDTVDKAIERLLRLIQRKLVGKAGSLVAFVKEYYSSLIPGQEALTGT